MSIEAILAATDSWAAAFNRGDASACASHYLPDATLHAEPFDPIQGKDDIEGFWANLIQGGFKDVSYLDRKIEMLDANRAVLSSPWSMNKASGVIVREEWHLTESGTWLLASDHFQILEQSE